MRPRVNCVSLWACLSTHWACLSGCGGGAEREEIPPIPVVAEDDLESSESGTDDASAPSGGLVDIKGVRFRIPDDWERAELTPTQAGFVDARFLIPVDGEQVQLTVTSVSGGIEANFDRWIGQFEIPAGRIPHRETIAVGGTDAHWIDISGTYSPGVGFTAGESQSGVRMLGVGIPLRTGGEMYLKLTGTESQIGTLIDALREVVKSARLP